VGGVQGMASQPDRSNVVKTRGQTAGQISGVLNEKNGGVACREEGNSV